MAIEKEIGASSKSNEQPEPGILRFAENAFDRNPVRTGADNSQGAPGDNQTQYAALPEKYHTFSAKVDTILASNTTTDKQVHNDSPTEANTVKDRGPIKSMDLPDGWKLSDTASGGIGQRSLETYSPPGQPDVKLQVYYRGLPVSDQGAENFQKILSAKPAQGRSEVLTPKEIRSLQEVMGSLTIGNNQYSNPGDVAPPAFHIQTASTAQINGKTVLQVYGDFVDTNGKAVNQYWGVFANSGDNGKYIEQVMLQGPPDKVPAHLKEYKNAINSIEWK